MSSQTTVNVTTDDGLSGTIDTSAWPLDGSRQDVLVRLDDGRALMTPLGWLGRQDDGSYRLKFGGADDTLGRALEAAGADRHVVPVLEERLLVGKREVETGRFVIRKRVVEERQAVEQALNKEQVVVERVPVGRLIDAPIAEHHEGDTLIIPVMEEVLVVEKRLMLREEVRVTWKVKQEIQREEVTVRREEVDLDQVEGKPDDSAALGTDVA